MFDFSAAIDNLKDPPVAKFACIDACFKFGQKLFDDKKKLR